MSAILGIITYFYNHLRVNRLAQIIGEVPGGDFTGAKCIGMGFVEVSNFYAKQAQKVKFLK